MGMAKKTYSDLLKHPFWQKKRLEIMRRDKFKCRKCGDEETTLNVHHKYYTNGLDPWDYPNDSMITLCEHCHKQIESIKKEIPEFEFNKIKIHKSDNWTSGKRIMLATYPGLLSIEIFDRNNNFIVGFNFTNKHERNEFIKAFKYSMK
jgi:hypothetical protein